MTAVRISYDDQPIHCVDILDSTGARFARLRPQEDGGATFGAGDAPAAHLSRADLEELAAALSRMARQ